MDKRYIVRRSPIDGWGVFTCTFVKQGDHVCSLRGELISVPELKKRYASRKERMSDPLQISEGMYLDLYKPWVFMNHSCNPNTGIQGRNEVIALRDLFPGEEITYDYSTTEWANDSLWGKKYAAPWNMRCHCRSANCRGIIEESPFLPQDVQRRYYQLNVLPQFILQKMKRIHQRKNNFLYSFGVVER